MDLILDLPIARQTSMKIRGGIEELKKAVKRVCPSIGEDRVRWNQRDQGMVVVRVGSSVTMMKSPSLGQVESLDIQRTNQKIKKETDLMTTDGRRSMKWHWLRQGTGDGLNLFA